MCGLEFDNLETEDLERTEQQEMTEQEETQEAMGYSSDYYRNARDYYYRSRNGHMEARAGVPFEEVLRAHNPGGPWNDINPKRYFSPAMNPVRRPVETPAEKPIEKTIEKPAEAPMGNLLKEALEKQELQEQKKPGMKIQQHSSLFPEYNISFKGAEATETNTAEAPEVPEKRILQTSNPYPRYNVSFRGKETDEQTDTKEAAEQKEEKEAMGYSSDYYESEMAKALEKGNQIAYDNARRNWAKAKVKEG